MGGGLLWFFLGAGAATMYHHKHANPNSDSQSGWGRCHAHFRAHNAGPHQSALPPLNTSAGQAPYPSSANDSLPGPSHPAAAPPTGPAMDPWAAEKERMMEIGKQVGVNVMEFSESTLDTLLSSIETMKGRVVQQRLEREKQETERKRLMDEQKMNPPRYV